MKTANKTADDSEDECEKQIEMANDEHKTKEWEGKQWTQTLKSKMNKRKNVSERQDWSSIVR